MRGRPGQLLYMMDKGDGALILSVCTKKVGEKMCELVLLSERQKGAGKLYDSPPFTERQRERIVMEAGLFPCLFFLARRNSLNSRRVSLGLGAVLCTLLFLSFFFCSSFLSIS